MSATMFMTERTVDEYVTSTKEIADRYHKQSDEYAHMFSRILLDVRNLTPSQIKEYQDKTVFYCEKRAEIPFKTAWLNIMCGYNYNTLLKHPDIVVLLYLCQAHDVGNGEYVTQWIKHLKRHGRKKEISLIKGATNLTELMRQIKMPLFNVEDGRIYVKDEKMIYDYSHKERSRFLTADGHLQPRPIYGLRKKFIQSTKTEVGADMMTMMFGCREIFEPIKKVIWLLAKYFANDQDAWEEMKKQVASERRKNI